MSCLLSLPSELLIQVAEKLLLPEVEGFAGTCRRLAGICSDRLQLQRKLRRQYRHIDTENLALNDLSWFQILLGILRDNIPAEYIEEIIINGEHSDLDSDKGCQGDDLALLLRAVKASRWIYGGKETEEHMAWFEYDDDRHTSRQGQGITSGMTDHIMSVLIPLLPNLRLLGLPTENLTLPRTVSRIAIAAAAQSSHDSNQCLLPLSKLTHIHGGTFNCFVGMQLEDVAPFIALPSVRTFEAVRMGDDSFEWPDSLPRSHLAVATFTDGCVTSRAIRAFARGLRGPCVVSQNWMYPRYHLLDAPHSDWTRIEIPYEDAPIEEWVVERDPEEVDHGVPSPDRFQRFTWSGADPVIELDTGRTSRNTLEREGEETEEEDAKIEGEVEP